jgi:hypothetical protein
MSRQRMTWGGDGRPAPTPRRASAHPATPWEGETHPAATPDPEADAYETGDPSSWAEDPHPPPYRTSIAPAVPYDDGGYRHPATQPGAPAKNASMNVRIAAEEKAKKCLRVATALLGPNVVAAAERGDKIAIDMLEDQAFDFMDMPDARLANTLLRIEAATEDEETLLRNMMAAEGGEEEEEKEEADAKATKKAAEGEIMAAINSLKAEIEALKAGKAPAVKPAMAEGDDEEAMLAAMLAEEKMGGQHMSEEDMMLAAMLKEAEAAPAVKPPMAAVPAVKPPMAAAPAVKPPMAMAEVEIEEPVMGNFEDPMAMDDAGMMGEEEQALLASLFASRAASDDEDDTQEEPAAKKASKKADDDEDADDVEMGGEEEEEEEQAPVAKKASAPALRPQPKKASAGAKTIGSQTRVASGGDLGDLAALWSSAPDVSSVFGS